jgi:hypothetical protein
VFTGEGDVTHSTVWSGEPAWSLDAWTRGPLTGMHARSHWATTSVTWVPSRAFVSEFKQLQLDVSEAVFLGWYPSRYGMSINRGAHSVMSRSWETRASRDRHDDEGQHSGKGSGSVPPSQQQQQQQQQVKHPGAL